MKKIENIVLVIFGICLGIGAFAFLIRAVLWMFNVHFHERLF